MKVLITGGAGFIGSNFVDRLMAAGHEVCVFDNLSSGSREHVRHHLDDGKFRFVQADVLDLPALKEAMASGVDLVIHTCSNPDIAKGMTQPDLDLHQGIVATFNVLEAMRLTGVKKIIFLSGSGVYGDVGETFTDENFSPLLPISMYGASKLAAEALISALCHMFDMQGWIFRLANIVGHRQTHGVIFDFVRKLLRNPRELDILGDGTQSKSYLHVSDVIDGILFVFGKTENRINIYNVSTNDFATVTEIADIVVREMKLAGVAYRYTGCDRGWKGDVPVVRIDTTKINRLGWKPRHSTAQAVELAIRENIESCK